MSSFRSKLPAEWQYGWRWTLLRRGVQSVFLSTGAFIVYSMFREEPEEGILSSKSYSLVYDDTGRPVDIMYKPIADAAARSKDRASRLME